MECPNCNQENPCTSIYCHECREKLAVTCSKCGLQKPDADKYCGECSQMPKRPFLTNYQTPENECDRIPIHGCLGEDFPEPFYTKPRSWGLIEFLLNIP